MTGTSYVQQLSQHTAVTNPVTMTTTSGITTYTFSGTITDVSPSSSQKPATWFYISRSPMIDNSDRSTYLGVYQGFYGNGSNSVTLQVGTGFLYGLVPGDTAYVILAVSEYCTQGGFDSGDGQTDYEALAPTGPQKGQMFVVRP